MKQPKEVGLNLWFAAGALLLGMLAVIGGSSAGAFVLLLMAAVWGMTGTWRALRIHRHVQARQRA